MRTQKKKLGDKLRGLRESYNLTQEQVADALNIDRSTYSNYELNKTHPNLDTLVKLSHIYNVPTELLLPDDDGSIVTFKDFARTDNLLQTLSKDERGLIALYRALDKDKKGEIREQMEKLAKKDD